MNSAVFSRPITIGILAGESSGDILGANLMQALKACLPDVTFVGIGGPLMQAQGCKSLYDMERLSVMGFIDPLFRLPELLRMRKGLQQYFLQNRPDVFIGIDSPDFNLGLELKLHQAGIPVIHYVSPSVWAWRQKRIFKIARATDLVLTLLPFEKAFYDQHRVPATFVGHTLADRIPLEDQQQAARKKLNLAADETYIAILPGSRRSELKYLAPSFIATAQRCWQMRPTLKFITAGVNNARLQEFQTLCQQMAPQVPMSFFEGCSHDVMAAANVVLVTSGTATLEVMLHKRPMVVAYRMNYLTYQIARHLVKLKFIGLPNLLADELLVPEFIQDQVHPDHLSAALLDYLDHPEKVACLTEKFSMLHQQLRCNASAVAAQAVMNFLSSNPTRIFHPEAS